MRKASQKSWFNGLLSLLFALLLFFNANATGNNPSNSGSSQTYSETLNNIPVQVQYDKDKYYVSGFEESVNVHLRSANRIQLNMESNADTRNPAPQVKVTVGLTAPTKDVPLNVSMTGTPPAGIAHYNYSLSTYQVRVSGPQSILDTLESIEVPVDISDIRKETKQSVTIPVNGEYVDEVDVSLSPVYNQQQSSNTNETSGEPASSTTAGSGSQAVQPSTSSQVESNTSETTSEGSTVESTTAGSTENTENQVTKENQNG